MRYRLHLSLTKKQYIELLLAVQERSERLCEGKVKTTVLVNAEKAMRKAWTECLYGKPST